MPVLLGAIISSNQQARADTGAMFPIFARTVTSTAVASITFSNIPSTYTHLQVRMMAKNSSANPYANNVNMNFNSDTGNNYAWHLLYGVGTNPGQFSANTSQPYIAYAGVAMGANTTSFGVSVIDIIDYKDTSKNKTARMFFGANGNSSATSEQIVGLGSGLWQNTNAITTITITPNAGNFTQYSSFALYGIK